MQPLTHDMTGRIAKRSKIADQWRNFIQAEGPVVGHAELGMGCGKRLFVLEVELFVELLARTRPAKGNLDRAVGQAGKADQVPRRSTIFTGSPMSSTKISPPRPMAAAWSTSWLASGMVMK